MKILITITTNLILTILFSLLLFKVSECQNLQVNGKVVNTKGEPIPGASVYFDGTTIGTYTNTQGNFSLNSRSVTNLPLVVYSLGYQLVTIDNWMKSEPLTISLESKPYDIEEVTVYASPFSQKQMLKVFREEFLGSDRAGRNSIIENEDDITLRYDPTSNTLYAYSDKPLVIKNSYLGYNLTYNLIEFYVKYNALSLSNDYMNHSLALGAVHFNEQEKLSKRQLRRRESCYHGSQLHFFRELAKFNFHANGFTLFSGSYPIMPSTGFKLTDTLGFVKVTVLPDKRLRENLTTLNLPNGYFSRSFNLLYKRKEQSLIRFQTPYFYIDELGANTHHHQILFGGELGKKKIGHLLPIDFQPKR